MATTRKKMMEQRRESRQLLYQLRRGEPCPGGAGCHCGRTNTEKQVRLGERKDLKSSTSSVASASQCQKCYQMGHWTYECKNERVYISRPSQTQQLKNPKHKSDKESDNDW
ncbi:hypothetical protein SASPL_105571 [Salvia splendens]|uniref:Zinc finger CCHC domain-containing protein 10 n=1 Tax=Salvia splendens TaxID=180675 RepID=A0A8X9A8T1_SALSN|nr:hypothetical protein SASPL_105571 [Salvia splendens]